MKSKSGPMCPGDPANTAPHPMAELAYRDELVRETKDNTITIPMRVVFCSECGHVFSVAPRPAR